MLRAPSRFPIGDELTTADRFTWDLDHTGGDDRRWRHSLFRRMPEAFAAEAARSYGRTWKTRGPIAANQELREAAPALSIHALRLASDNEAINTAAKNRASECTLIRAQMGSRQAAYDRLAAMAQNHGIQPPEVGKGISLKGAIARLCDERWWRRGLRRKFGRAFEHQAIKMRMVCRQRALYVSDQTFKRRREQKARNRSLLAAMVAINEQGDELSLEELAEHSVSNPKLRRAELMTRIAGCEQYANRLGYGGLFLTFTCPSRYHATVAAPGGPNPAYAGADPREAQKFLCNVWARIRSALKRKEVDCFGVRIAEPHHDATVHWHLLIFAPTKELETINQLCRDRLLADSPNEPGAQEHRFKTIPIDYEKGTAAGYVAKYVSKNIDGEHVGADLEDTQARPARETAPRVDAWAGVWGIRQFQFFGVPRVTIWRELRRLRNPIEGPLEPYRLAADRGDWASFMALYRAEPARLAVAWSDEPGLYGDPVGPVVIGVELQNVTVPTRFHTWAIGMKQEADLTLKTLADSIRIRNVRNESPQISERNVTYTYVRAKTGPFSERNVTYTFGRNEKGQPPPPS